MHPENIKAELRKKWGTVKAFEAARDLPADSVRDVLRGRSVRKTADAIADELEKSLATLFPGRFAYGPRESTSRKRDAHGLSERAV